MAGALATAVAPPWRRALVALGFAALALGPAAAARAGPVELPLQIGGAYRVTVQSLAERRFGTTVRQRHDFSCGSAALATLLTHHYRHPVDEAEVFDAMFDRGDADKIAREGFSLLDMKRYLEAHGFAADGFEEPLETLAEAGIPAIVLIDEGGYHHFVVVKGLADGRVLIGDPARGVRSMSSAAFGAARVDGVLFVISNRREAAGFNLAADWQAAPASPLAGAIGRDGLSQIVVPKLGPADF